MGGWVRAFPRLKHLYLHARAITVSPSLARVASLTSLDLNFYVAQRDALDMHEQCLPTSLRHLCLTGIDVLPTAVAQVMASMPSQRQLVITYEMHVMHVRCISLVLWDPLL